VKEPKKKAGERFHELTLGAEDRADLPPEHFRLKSGSFTVPNRKSGDNPLIDMVETGNHPYGVGDNPLTDMFAWGKHPFPPDIEELLRKLDTLSTSPGGRVPIWQNWTYRGREWGWASGRALDGARRDLRHLLTIIEAGREDEVLVDPITRKPLRSP